MVSKELWEDDLLELALANDAYVSILFSPSDGLFERGILSEWLLTSKIKRSLRMNSGEPSCLRGGYSETLLVELIIYQLILEMSPCLIYTENYFSEYHRTFSNLYFKYDFFVSTVPSSTSY